jgi:hypothetical protein
VTRRASLAEVRRAVESAVAFLELGTVGVFEAVDVACDHLRIVTDADRRIVRKAVERRFEPERRRRVS